MTKYTELDSKILNKIGGHPAPFSSLYVKDVAEECIRIANERISQNPFAFSIADSRRYVKLV